MYVDVSDLLLYLVSERRDTGWGGAALHVLCTQHLMASGCD
jgi:hypothetical protein